MTSGERSAQSGSNRTNGPSPGGRAPQRGLFRQEGEFWTVGYDGRTFRLKDTPGLIALHHAPRILLQGPPPVVTRGRSSSSQSRSGLKSPLLRTDMNSNGCGAVIRLNAPQLIDWLSRSGWPGKCAELTERPATSPFVHETGVASIILSWNNST
jgi:hypothetical protein